MASLADAEKYATQKSLEGNAMHGSGKAPAEYGIKYIPHKAIIDKNGKVVKNFTMKSIPEELDALLASGGAMESSSTQEPPTKEEKKDDVEEEDE